MKPKNASVSGDNHQWLGNLYDKVINIRHGHRDAKGCSNLELLNITTKAGSQPQAEKLQVYVATTSSGWEIYTVVTKDQTQST